MNSLGPFRCNVKVTQECQPLSVKVNYYVYNRKTMGEIFIFAILEL